MVNWRRGWGWYGYVGAEAMLSGWSPKHPHQDTGQTSTWADTRDRAAASTLSRLFRSSISVSVSNMMFPE